MSTFTLDTSGAVGPMPVGPYHERFLTREDLPLFAQGYVEALFASSLEDIREDAFRRGLALSRRRRWNQIAFSDLHPEALAMILRDCSSMEAIASGVGIKKLDADKGRNFWNSRQSGGSALAPTISVAFPPLRVSLDDAGKVQLTALTSSEVE